MSATRDKTQKVAFVYSNLYRIYRKGKEAAETAEAPAPFSGKVLKAGNFVQNPAFTGVQINAFRPMELIAKRTENPAIASLKNNLQQLNELHERLQFMLKELEDLAKE